MKGPVRACAVHCYNRPESRNNLTYGVQLFHMSLTLIIVIGWLYVTVLVAANEPTVVSGIISFLFYGALPCGLLLYFAGSRVRRERRRFREKMADKAKEDGDA